ncbi:hypothetical protein GCM10010278_08860 [Streptomyces melanogenes]|nr:hypothetical protein GCM10010278_08860 [Streptomyces melanogenes]
MSRWLFCFCVRAVHPPEAPPRASPRSLPPPLPPPASVPAMDTLIFGGLLVVVVGIWRRGVVGVGVWWVVFVATCFLLAHHITSGLGLGLSY